MNATVLGAAALVAAAIGVTLAAEPSRAAKSAQAPERPPTAGSLPASRLAQAMGSPPAPGPQINYMLACMGCHVADGSGAPGKVPSVRDSLVPLSATPEGRRYLVQVPGSSQSPLSDAELAQVLNWMVRNLTNQAVPDTFAEFTAAEVSAYRKTPLVNVSATRARLLATQH